MAGKQCCVSIATQYNAMARRVARMSGPSTDRIGSGPKSWRFLQVGSGHGSAHKYHKFSISFTLQSLYSYDNTLT